MNWSQSIVTRAGHERFVNTPDRDPCALQQTVLDFAPSFSQDEHYIKTRAGSLTNLPRPWQGGLHESGMWPTRTANIADDQPSAYGGFFMAVQTPLADLINTRMRELGLTRQALGFRLGYHNPLKAGGRVYALCDGNLRSRKSRT